MSEPKNEPRRRPSEECNRNVVRSYHYDSRNFSRDQKSGANAVEREKFLQEQRWYREKRWP